MKNILKRLSDPVILGATLLNVFQILALFGVNKIFGYNPDIYMKSLDLVIASLIQWGIMKQPNATKGY